MVLSKLRTAACSLDHGGLWPACNRGIICRMPHRLFRHSGIPGSRRRHVQICGTWSRCARGFRERDCCQPSGAEACTCPLAAPRTRLCFTTISKALSDAARGARSIIGCHEPTPCKSFVRCRRGANRGAFLAGIVKGLSFHSAGLFKVQIRVQNEPYDEHAGVSSGRYR